MNNKAQDATGKISNKNPDKQHEKAREIITKLNLIKKQISELIVQVDKK